MPSPAALFGSLIFGIVGIAAFRYGKKSALVIPMILGIALMVYPYFVPETWLIYAIGSAMTCAVWFFRK
ncbi:MAG TPA: hypothetical protein VMH26_01380 [Burkholderiales bacterium]|nr:hypothetical protein [Burkholderiales bacterium]